MENQTNIEASQVKIKELEAEKAQLNPNNPDDRFRITVIDQALDAIRADIQQAEKADMEQQIHVEVQELVLGKDFNAVFGHPDANKIIYTLLYEEKLKHLEELRTKNDANQLLVSEIDQLKSDILNVGKTNSDLAEAVSELTKEKMELQENNERLMNESRSLRNEVNRLEGVTRDLNNRLELEQQKAASFQPRSSETLDALLADAANTTKQKRLVTNLEALDKRKSMYRAKAEDGSEVKIGWLELGQYEVVDNFPAPPAGDQVDEEPVTEGDLDAAEREVAAASTEADRFPGMVSEDSSGFAVETSAGEALEAADEVAEGEAADADAEAQITDRLTALEAWKESVEERLAGLTFQR